MTKGGGGDREPKLDVDLQKHIGKKLKTYYDQVVSEPVPDRLLKLLEQLEAGSKNKGSDQDGSSNRGNP